jgi:hypothetical protein
VSVEDTLVKMAEDKTPPSAFAKFLWVSKPEPSRKRARQLAELAIGTIGREAAELPKAGALKIGTENWRGVVYAGRRSRREVAKAGA